jgi:hypothetical protein
MSRPANAARRGRDIAVFNGDADGLCALRQLRGAEQVERELVTGVKRDIELLERVTAAASDRVTVLDVSFDRNRGALERLLAAGAHVRFFDHHYAGEIPAHPRLEVHIDESSDVCTSLIVDRFLRGAQRPWALVGCFGDGLVSVGVRLAADSGIGAADASLLQELGECLNYNAYGETVDDLSFPPAELFAILARHTDPRELACAEPAFRVLRERRRDDLELGMALAPIKVSAGRAVYVLPDEAWSRRVSGVLANRLAERDPARALSVLSHNSLGGYVVSVRAPARLRRGAGELCRKFPTGGGRATAGGINDLRPERMDEFLRAVADAVADGG